MIALDTNLVVRLLVEDDAAQLAEARRVLRTAEVEGESCFVSDIVLCEVEWVLESLYEAQKHHVLTAVQRLLAEPLFSFESRDRARRALEAYERGDGDLSDHLIGTTARDHQARTTYTFDRVLRQQEGFTFLRA